MCAKPIPSQEFLHARFIYEPDTGILRWRNAARSHPAGAIAGTKRTQAGQFPHIIVNLDKSMYLAHRLIWKIMTGCDPALSIDHINGDGLDNRWGNLREATQEQQTWNARMHCDNTSGFKGVSLHQRGKWRARIYHRGTKKELGLFADPAEAHAAYAKAARELRGAYARG